MIINKELTIHVKVAEVSAIFDTDRVGGSPTMEKSVLIERAKMCPEHTPHTYTFNVKLVLPLMDISVCDHYMWLSFYTANSFTLCEFVSIDGNMISIEPNINVFLYWNLRTVLS